MRLKQQQKEDEERDRKKKEEKIRKEESARKVKEEEESRLTTEQKEALILKDQANALYTQKKYAEALVLYDEAIKKDVNNINFYNNKGACYFSMKEYQACIDVSTQGLEIGELNHAPFDKKALALQRIGNSHLQLGNLDASIEALKNLC